jgi:hypothetical protein
MIASDSYAGIGLSARRRITAKFSIARRELYRASKQSPAGNTTDASP